jgi:hypothetical protein
MMSANNLSPFGFPAKVGFLPVICTTVVGKSFSKNLRFLYFSLEKHDKDCIMLSCVGKNQ